VGTVALDTSVILALFDPDDALHAAAAAAARRLRDAGETFLMPATVLAEVLVSAATDEAQLERRRSLAVAAFGSPWPVDEAVAVAAAVRRTRHRTLRLPDALVLATADVAGADLVLTGNKRWRDTDPRVELIG
jgi:predicted nucleic acid-binding protein